MSFLPPIPHATPANSAPRLAAAPGWVPVCRASAGSRGRARQPRGTASGDRQRRAASPPRLCPGPGGSALATAAPAPRPFSPTHRHRARGGGDEDADHHLHLMSRRGDGTGRDGAARGGRDAASSNTGWGTRPPRYRRHPQHPTSRRRQPLCGEPGPAAG